MITPLRYGSGKLTTIVDGTASDTTITKFDLLDWSSGYLQRATSSGSNIVFMAMEDVTTASGAHEDILVLNLTDVECEGDTDGAADVTQRGTFIDLEDHETLDEDATDVNAFYVTEFVDTGTLRGYFTFLVS
jgi:hypothetical protein